MGLFLFFFNHISWRSATVCLWEEGDHFTSVLIKASSIHTRPEGHKWDPLLWCRRQRPALWGRRSSLCQPTKRKKRHANCGLDLIIYLFFSKDTCYTVSHWSTHPFTNLTVSTHHHLFPSKHDASGSLQPERRVQHSQVAALCCASVFTCFTITTWLITRPVWTPCSSRGCQISAWSLSR